MYSYCIETFMGNFHKWLKNCKAMKIFRLGNLAVMIIIHCKTKGEISLKSFSSFCADYGLCVCQLYWNMHNTDGIFVILLLSC